MKSVKLTIVANFGVILCLSLLPASASADTIRVMTYNLWHGGDAGGQPLEKSVAVIQAANADLIGLQETGGYPQRGERPDNAKKIAEILGFHYFNQGGRTGILSRYPILQATPLKWGVQVSVPEIGPVYLFNAHLSAAPYQPYQLLNIPYHNGRFIKTEEEAISEAKAARGRQVQRLLSELTPVISEGSTVFLTGDFNEPSHLDWTTASVEAKHCPVPVQWPTSQAITRAGLRDGYRLIYSNAVTHQGLTWTPLTKVSDPGDHHDRIDLVYASQRAIPDSAFIVGESKRFADLVVDAYPSDHRAVVIEYKVNSSTSKQ